MEAHRLVESVLCIHKELHLVVCCSLCKHAQAVVQRLQGSQIAREHHCVSDGPIQTLASIEPAMYWATPQKRVCQVESISRSQYHSRGH